MRRRSFIVLALAFAMLDRDLTFPGSFRKAEIGAADHIEDGVLRLQGVELTQ